VRVVNLAGGEDSDLVRLPDYDGYDEGYLDAKGEDEEEEYGDGGYVGRVGGMRGRTLGCFGPRSRVRLFLFRFLVHP
jgi:hypothetical protein